MILYHGSYMEVSRPDTLHSRAEVDFGKGFYTTPLLEQAEKWCGKFRKKGQLSIVNQYQLDVSALTTCNVLRFESYSRQWLEFVVACRLGKDTTSYDIVIGGVANDKVFNTVELFFDGLIDIEEAIKRLRYEKPNAQLAFRSQSVLETYLSFERSWQL